MHKVGSLGATRPGTSTRPPRRQSFPTLGASPRRPSPACRSTTGRCSRPPTHEIGTVSSERLAELAGVNAAKVRKDLSLPRLLRHPGRRLRRRVPPPRDLARARPHPGLAGRHRRRRQPRPRARQLPRLRRPRLPRRRRSSTPTRQGGRARRRARHRRRSTTCPAIARERDIAIGIIATPGARGPGGRRPPRRRRRHVDPQLRADGRQRPRRASRCARSTSPSSCRSSPSTSSARPAHRCATGANGEAARSGDHGAALSGRRRDHRLPGEPRRRGTPLRRRGRRPHRRPEDRRAPRGRAPTSHVVAPEVGARCGRWADAGRLTARRAGVRSPPTSTAPGSPPRPPTIPTSTTPSSRPARPAGSGSTRPTTRRTARSP